MSKCQSLNLRKALVKEENRQSSSVFEEGIFHRIFGACLLKDGLLINRNDQCSMRLPLFSQSKKPLLRHLLLSFSDYNGEHYDEQF